MISSTLDHRPLLLLRARQRQRRRQAEVLQLALLSRHMSVLLRRHRFALTIYTRISGCRYRQRPPARAPPHNTCERLVAKQSCSLGLAARGVRARRAARSRLTIRSHAALTSHMAPVLQGDAVLQTQCSRAAELTWSSLGAHSELTHSPKTPAARGHGPISSESRPDMGRRRGVVLRLPTRGAGRGWVTPRSPAVVCEIARCAAADGTAPRRMCTCAHVHVYVYMCMCTYAYTCTCSRWLQPMAAPRRHALQPIAAPPRSPHPIRSARV